MSLPPNDFEAEAACLCAALLSPARIANSKLRPEHFYARRHATIWAGILAASAKGEVDPVSVASELKALGRWEEIPKGYLVETLNAAPSLSETAWQAYERAVLDTFARREALKIIQAAQAELYEGFDVPTAEYLQSTAKSILGIVACQQSARISTYDEAITSLVRNAASRAATKVSTGLAFLDEAMGGLFPGDLTVIAARPGMGKTSLATQMCSAVATAEKRALFVSLEMPAEEVFGRALGSASGVPFSVIRGGKLTVQDATRLQRGSERIRAAQRRVAVVEMFGPSVQDIRRVVVEQIAHAPLHLVAIDYLQLMKLANPKDVVNSIQEITAGLKALAKEFRVPIILLSQLNRGVESRDNKRPSLSDLRASGSIEQDADNVILIYRAGYYSTPKQHTGPAELDLAKCRNGEPQVVAVHWDGPSTSFSDMEPMRKSEAAE